MRGIGAGGGRADADRGGLAARRRPISRAMKFAIAAAALVAVAAAVVGGFEYRLYSRHFETTDDAFIDGTISQVAAQAAGRVQAVLVRDNQHVKAGDVLIEIDPRESEIRLEQAHARRTQAVAEVALRHAQVRRAEAEVLVAQANADQAERDLHRYRKVDRKAITGQQLDNANAEAAIAKAKLKTAEQAVAEANAQVSAADASVTLADVAIKDAELQLSYTKVVAPISGYVTRRTVEVGNVIAVGQPLLAVVSDDLWVIANFKETQLDHIRVGQPVRLSIDAFPDADLTGHVDSLQRGTGSKFSSLPAENATGNFVKVVQRVPVKIVFDNVKARDRFPLAPGMSVDPSVRVR
jgi:membrane fusion protein, multidrug efflux system